MHSGTPHISVVAPAYRCAECLPELCRRIKETVEKLSPDFELIIVNDGSPDRDWEVVQELAAGDARVKGINLSRNFGQHHAITAGIDHATGDWVVVMDCDLQDPPEEIANLYRKATDEGFDIVLGRRAGRKDRWLKRLSSRIFKSAYNFLSDVQTDPAVANFSIASAKVIESYRRLREGDRSHGLTLLWCGFKTGYVDVKHAKRFAGQSAYNWHRSVQHALESVTSHSNKPLRMSIKLGLTMSFASFAFALYTFIRYWLRGVAVTGWTSLIVSLYFLGGMLMANMGILGLYLGKVFDESKNRPIYLVRDTLNMAKNPLDRRGPQAALFVAPPS